MSDRAQRTERRPEGEAPTGVPPVLAERAWTLGVLLLLVVAVSLLGSSGAASLERSTITMLINLVIVVGLYVFIGNSGVFSFGQLAFMAIGAYATTILLIPAETKELVFAEMPHALQSAELPALPAMLVGGVIATIVAALLSAPLMRLSGLNAALGTFAVLIIVNVVANNWEQVTNGSTGMSGIPTTGFSTFLLIALGAIAVAWLFQQTRICMRLRASREDEYAARSIGVRIPVVRGVAFCLSAFLVAIAGGLFSQAQGAISPDAFYLQLTFITIAMLVVGGINTLTGAVVGTLVISIISELLIEIENGLDLGFATLDGPTGLREVGLAVVMLAILITRPNGITGGREFTWPVGRMKRRRFEAQRELAAPAGRPGTEGGGADVFETDTPA